MTREVGGVMQGYERALARFQRDSSDDGWEPEGGGSWSGVETCTGES